jgi:amino acid transporter
VIGTGFDTFTKTATAAANPWRDLGIVFWGGGWVLVFFAIINSALANSNAGATAASRVLYSLGRNGVLPKAFARTHPTHKTPHVAIIFQTVLGLVVALALGWKYGDLITAFSIIATAVTVVVIVVYIIVCFATVVYFSRRENSNPWLHWVLPILGAAAFVPPLYYQYFPLPGYPVRYANWVALGWLGAGLIVVALLPKRALDHVEDLFTDAPPAAATAEPTA